MFNCKRHGWLDSEMACPLCYEEMPELTRAEQHELALYFRAEFRRVRRPEKMRASAPVVYKPRALTVPVAKPAAEVPMSLPGVLCAGDTQASLERRRAILSSYEFWQRPPGNFYHRAADVPTQRAILARNDFRVQA